MLRVATSLALGQVRRPVQQGRVDQDQAGHELRPPEGEQLRQQPARAVADARLVAADLVDQRGQIGDLAVYGRRSWAGVASPRPAGRWRRRESRPPAGRGWRPRGRRVAGAHLEHPSGRPWPASIQRSARLPSCSRPRATPPGCDAGARPTCKAR